jgi:hypothetical protein
MSWTTADLLSTIQNREMFPDASTGSLSPAVLLQFATEELYLTVVPLLTGIREKYYETYLDTLYTPSTASITLPQRALGNALSSVQFIYNNMVRQLMPIDPGQITTVQPSAYPDNFYFQNNSIVLYPPPNASLGTIRMRYFQRPNRLEQTINCAQITNVNLSTGVVTCTPPTAWTTSNTFDFIPKYAGQATPYGLGSTISNISGSSMTFSSIPQTAVVGDWIALTEYTPIPEIPFELQALLAQATACRALAAVNDPTGLPNAKGDLQIMAASAVKLLTPRDQGGSKRIVSGWRQF